MPETKQQTEAIDLAEIYNNCLACEYIPTVQPWEPNKFYIGQDLELRLKGRPPRHRVKLVATHSFLLKNLTDTLSLLAFGCDAEKGRKIIQRQYSRQYGFYKSSLQVALYIWQRQDEDLFGGTAEP